MKKRYLILEDGTIFQGWGFGADKEVTGELAFHTNVVGYVENLTDPANYGQIVMQTFPMVGNYGIMDEDFEGKPGLFGYVVKEYCARPSNFRCEYDLDTFLKNHDIPGLCGVDTRELTNRIREYGVVNAMICEKLPEDFDEIAAYKITDAVEAVTVKEITEYAPEGEQKFHVVLVDFGTRESLITALIQMGCKVTVVPAGTSSQDIKAMDPDGIVLSDGPGDPREKEAYIEMVRRLVGRKPLFAVGLGHQILALAMGGQVTKMKHGHHGGNQPCRRIGTRRTYITGQSHTYVVSGEVPCAVESFVNVNDGSCEGLEYPEQKAMSVQFRPDGCPELFNIFQTMMKEG